MNWKYLLPLPLAALWLGHPLHAPTLHRPLSPSSERPDCHQEQIMQSYLMAYAYAEENPRAAWLFLESAKNSLRESHDCNSDIEQRIQDLQTRLKSHKAHEQATLNK